MNRTFEVMKKTDDEDSNKIVKDGTVLRVPVFMMDSAQRDGALVVDRTLNKDRADTGLLHRPGFVPMTDAAPVDRAALYQARDAKLADAWKNPPALDQATPNAAKPMTGNDALYAERDRRLEEAWR